jgi:hypothetical protein
MVRSATFAAVLVSATGWSHAVNDQAELIRAALMRRDPQPVIVLPAVTLRVALTRSANHNMLCPSKVPALPRAA